MDAEKMLDELVNLGIRYSDDMLTLDERKELSLRHDEIVTRLAGYIRAGLALQRLEKWLPEGHEFNIGRAYGVYGAKVWKMIGEHRVSGTGQTLLEAINAALDAAGAEK